jgi:cupin 2 domain-containing protein
VILKQRLFPSADPPTRGERVEALLARPGLLVERILSGPHQASGPYLQDRDEWVALLQGEAVLEVAGEEVRLAAGEALLLAARTPHRVLDTSADPPCVWLAVHAEPDPEAP